MSECAAGNEYWTLVNAGLTTVNAIVVTFLMWRQNRTGREQLKLALYDKRHKVLNGLRATTRQVFHNGKLDIDEWSEFAAATVDAGTIFDKKIDAALAHLRDEFTMFVTGKPAHPQIKESTLAKCKETQDLILKALAISPFEKVSIEDRAKFSGV